MAEKHFDASFPMKQEESSSNSPVNMASEPQNYAKALELLGREWLDISPFAIEDQRGPLENNFDPSLRELEMFVSLSNDFGVTNTVYSSAKIVENELQKVREAPEQPDELFRMILETIDFDHHKTNHANNTRYWEASREESSPKNLRRSSPEPAQEPLEAMDINEVDFPFSTEQLRDIVESISTTSRFEETATAASHEETYPEINHFETSVPCHAIVDDSPTRSPKEECQDYDEDEQKCLLEEKHQDYDVDNRSPEEYLHVDDNHTDETSSVDEQQDGDNFQTIIPEEDDDDDDDLPLTEIFKNIRDKYSPKKPYANCEILDHATTSSKQIPVIDIDSPKKQIPVIEIDCPPKNDRFVRCKNQYEVTMQRKKQEESVPSKRAFSDYNGTTAPILPKVPEWLQPVLKRPVIEPIVRVVKRRKLEEKKSLPAENNDWNLDSPDGIFEENICDIDNDKDALTTSESNERPDGPKQSEGQDQSRIQTAEHEVAATFPVVNRFVISRQIETRHLRPTLTTFIPNNLRDPRIFGRRMPQPGTFANNYPQRHPYPNVAVNPAIGVPYAGCYPITNYNREFITSYFPVDAIERPSYISSYPQVLQLNRNGPRPSFRPSNPTFVQPMITAIRPRPPVIPPHSIIPMRMDAVMDENGPVTMDDTRKRSNQPGSARKLSPASRPTPKKVVLMLPCTLKNTDGNRILSAAEATRILLTFDVNCLVDPVQNDNLPPRDLIYFDVQEGYNKFSDYFNTYFPILLVETWSRILSAWHNSQTVVFKQYHVNSHTTKMNGKSVKSSVDWCCTYNFFGATAIPYPETGDLLLLVIGHGHQEVRMFGYVEKHIYTSLERGDSKKCVAEIRQTSQIYVKTMYEVVKKPSTVKIAVILSLRTCLNQFEALFQLGTSTLRDTVLTPKTDQCKQVSIRNMDPDSINVAVESILYVAKIREKSPHFVMVRSRQLSTTELSRTICSFITQAKRTIFGKDEPARMLVCTRGLQAIRQLGEMLAVKDLKMVIIATPEQLRHTDLEQFTLDEVARTNVNPCSSYTSVSGSDALNAVLKNCDVVLALVADCYDSRVNGVLGVDIDTSFRCCILHEGYYCTEMEALVPIRYNIRKFIIFGDPAQEPCIKSKMAKSKGYKMPLVNRLYKR